MQGESIIFGAPSKCPNCKTRLKLEVLRSEAGYYVGTACDCGPYSRESGYYPTFDSAQKALNSKEFDRF